MKLEGADSVLSNCRGPLEDEFVSTACIPGDAVTKGKATLLTRCSPIPPGSYVSLACKAGDPYHEGHDLVSLPCSDPPPGTYVVEICVTGSTKSKGSDTKTKVCSEVINASSQRIYAECVSGSKYALGSDAVIKSTCEAGFIQDGEYRCTPCPDNKSTAKDGSSTCSVCQQGFYQSLIVDDDGLHQPPSSFLNFTCTPCPERGACSGFRSFPLPQKGYQPTANGAVMVKCLPEESCRLPQESTGAVECAEGYGGDLCRLCDSAGSYYRLNEKCVKCPTWSFGALLSLYGGVGIVAGGAALLVFHRLRLDKRLILQAVSSLQVLNTISNLNCITVSKL